MNIWNILYKIYEKSFLIERWYYLGVSYFNGHYCESGFAAVKFPRNSFMGICTDSRRLEILKFEAKMQLFQRHAFNVNKINEETSLLNKRTEEFAKSMGFETFIEFKIALDKKKGYVS